MLSALANVTSSRPARVLAVAAVVSIVSLIVSSGLTGRLATQGFVNENSESEHALNDVVDAAGFDPGEDIVALVKAPGGAKIESDKGAAEVNEVARLLSSLDGVVAVATPVGDALVAGGEISKDGRTGLVIAHTQDGAPDTDLAERAVALFEGNDNVKLGGALIAQHYVSETVSEDLARSELIAFPLLFLISLFVFRSLLAALLPLLIGAITIPLTMMMISFYNELTSLSIFALNLTTGLGLGLAIDYALLTITRYREELATGVEPRVALTTTMNTAGRTIVFSALTVAGAVLVLGIFPLKFLYSMAFAGSTVAIASAVVSLTVLPAALMLIGNKLDRWSLARRSIDESVARWERLARRVMKRPGLMAGAVTLLILVLMLPIRNIAFTSVDASVLPGTNQAHQVQQLQEKQFPEGRGATVLVTVEGTPDSKDAAKLAARVKQVDGVTGTTTPTYMGLNTWSFDVQTKENFYAASALQVVRDIRGLAGHDPVYMNYKVGGLTASFVDQRATILDRVPLALLLILAITFVVLFLMTGSVVLPIKTFIMNLLTLGATFGILTWIFGEGHLEGLLDYTSQDALEMTQPVLLFVMAFALATDYGVFLLGRIKELRDQGLSNDDAVAIGVGRTGRVITSAALLFCVAIGAFSLSGIVFIKELGLGTALAVAIDATLVRALLVPALMALLGEYNWWAPAPLRRLHERFGLSEGPSAGEPIAEPEPAT